MKTLLADAIKREEALFNNLQVGTDEYEASLGRLINLKAQLNGFENNEKEKEICSKDRKLHNVLEVVKVGGGVLLPIIGLIGITAVEKEITFTGALRDYTKYFLPKKMN